MKTLRTLLALAFVTVFAGSFAVAGPHGKKSDASADKDACCAVASVEKKDCAMAKDSCCSGDKAAASKGEKKAESKPFMKRGKRSFQKDACCMEKKNADADCKSKMDCKKPSDAACDSCK